MSIPVFGVARLGLISIMVATASGAAADDGAPPNILYILADDLGYAELGCYGQTKIRTPNLDRLAAEGLRFTRHYAGSPVCAPSRCVLLTGRHTGHSAIRGNREIGGWSPEAPEGQWPLPSGEVTIAEIARARGYSTAAFGKWGLGGPGTEGHPNRQGFDHFYGYLCQRVAHNYYPTHLWRNHDVDVLHGNRYFPAHQRLEEAPSEATAFERYRGSDYAPAEIVEEALRWIETHRDQPFFIYYASVIPHAALQVPPDELAAYPPEWDERPYLGENGYLPHPRPRAAYAAMISHLDRNVGRLLDALDAHGLADRTLVMFSSDNGTTFNGGCDRAFFASLGMLRGHKCTVYEGGLRVPLIARWPGRIPPGRTTDHVSGFQDLLPTVVDVIDGTRPGVIDGISFLPTLLGEPAQPSHEWLYWEYPERDRQQAVLMGRHKGVRTKLRGGETAVQLYDLASDPGEQRDIAADHPKIVERMLRVMEEDRVPSEVFPFSGAGSGNAPEGALGPKGVLDFAAVERRAV